MRTHAVALLVVTLLAAIGLVACSGDRPSSRNQPLAAAGSTRSVTAACAAYRRALDMSTPYARAGLLTPLQDQAVTQAIEDAGPVCLTQNPDQRMLPVVNGSLASLAAAGIPVN